MYNCKGFNDNDLVYIVKNNVAQYFYCCYLAIYLYFIINHFIKIKLE